MGISPSHARTIRARDSIPAERHHDFVMVAKDLGLTGITYELLAKLAAKRKQPKSARAEATS